MYLSRGTRLSLRLFQTLSLTQKKQMSLPSTPTALPYCSGRRALLCGIFFQACIVGVEAAAETQTTSICLCHRFKRCHSARLHVLYTALVVTKQPFQPQLQA
jgi:hypothetical protein